MNLIVAVDEKWGIGKDGGLLAHLPEDMKYFRETTSGSSIQPPSRASVKPITLQIRLWRAFPVESP